MVIPLWSFLLVYGACTEASTVWNEDGIMLGRICTPSVSVQSGFCFFWTCTPSIGDRAGYGFSRAHRWCVVIVPIRWVWGQMGGAVSADGWLALPVGGDFRWVERLVFGLAGRP